MVGEWLFDDGEMSVEETSVLSVSIADGKMSRVSGSGLFANSDIGLGCLAALNPSISGKFTIGMFHNFTKYE